MINSIKIPSTLDQDLFARLKSFRSDLYKHQGIIQSLGPKVRNYSESRDFQLRDIVFKFLDGLIRISELSSIDQDVPLSKDASQAASRYYLGLAMMRPEINKLLNGSKFQCGEFYTDINSSVKDTMTAVDRILTGEIYLHSPDTRAYPLR